MEQRGNFLIFDFESLIQSFFGFENIFLQPAVMSFIANTPIP